MPPDCRFSILLCYLCRSGNGIGGLICDIIFLLLRSLRYGGDRHAMLVALAGVDAELMNSITIVNGSAGRHGAVLRSLFWHLSFEKR